MRISPRLIGLGLACFALVCLAITFASYAVVRNQLQVDETAKTAARNKQAIQVACILITNLIAESGAGGRQVSGRPVPPQLKLNALYVKAIGRIMTKEERKQERELKQQIAKDGGIVTFPDCKQIVAHPDQVQAFRLKLAKRPGP